MGKPVKLSEIAGELEMQMDETRSYLDARRWCRDNGIEVEQ